MEISERIHETKCKNSRYKNNNESSSDQTSLTGVQEQVLLDVGCEHLLHQARLGSRL